MTRRTSTRFAAFAAVAVLGAGGATTLLAPAGAATADASAPVTLQATLEASGDSDGSGHAVLTLTKAKKKVCATIHWSSIKKPTAAHIHRASDGAIVVDLTGAVTGGAACTTGVGKAKIQKILDRPGRYYVNVHNTPYPAGAIQGDLHK